MGDILLKPFLVFKISAISLFIIRKHQGIECLLCTEYIKTIETRPDLTHPVLVVLGGAEGRRLKARSYQHKVFSQAPV